MLLKIARLTTILFIALSMGPAICHFLEMPAKMSYDGSIWLMLHHTLYQNFGKLGAFFEVGAVLLSIWLTYLVRRSPLPFFWTFIGAFCLVLAHAAFWLWIDPVNRIMISATEKTLPENWEVLRLQWEYTHSLRAVLETMALAAIVYSILAESPIIDANSRQL